jgi:hypothetical protein
VLDLGEYPQVSKYNNIRVCACIIGLVMPCLVSILAVFLDQPSMFLLYLKIREGYMDEIFMDTTRLLYLSKAVLITSISVMS